MDAELADEAAMVVAVARPVHLLTLARELCRSPRSHLHAVPDFPGVPVAVSDAVDTARILRGPWAARPVDRAGAQSRHRVGQRAVEEVPAPVPRVEVAGKGGVDAVHLVVAAPHCE